MEYNATAFSDYSKLHLDEWRKYSMKMTRRGGPRFPLAAAIAAVAAEVCVIHFFRFSCKLSSTSIYPVQYHPIAENTRRG